MKNKFWAITAGVLIACGVCFALLGMALVGFDFDKIDNIRGMDIIICTTANNDKDAKALLAAFNFPFYN